LQAAQPLFAQGERIMKFDFDAATIIYKPGESVRLEVDSYGTSHRVNFDIGGQPIDVDENKPLKFALDKEHRGKALTIHFAFSEPSGGEYHLRVIGKHGIEVATRSVKQRANDPIRILAFGLEGDPDTDAD
jgi:hypothetical protein